MNNDFKRKEFYKQLNNFLVSLDKDYLKNYDISYKWDIPKDEIYNYDISYKWDTSNDKIYDAIITKVKFIVDSEFDKFISIVNGTFDFEKENTYEMTFIYDRELLCYIDSGDTSVPINIKNQKEITNFFIEMFLFNKIEEEDEK
jgi:hypothetical protein